MLATMFELLAERQGWFFELFLQHTAISGISIALAAAIGLSIGIAISEWRRGARPVLALVNFVYTIPSIALFGFLIPVTGVGNVTAVAALTVYALLPMVRSTYAGITSVDPRIVEAARGMGSTDRQVLYRIELPLAVPVIMSGLRTMATMTIALAGIASFIGAGGLGVAIYRGITTNNLAMTLAGSVLIAVLALAVDALLGAAEKLAKRQTGVEPRGRVSLDALEEPATWQEEEAAQAAVARATGEGAGTVAGARDAVRAHARLRGEDAGEGAGSAPPAGPVPAGDVPCTRAAEGGPAADAAAGEAASAAPAGDAEGAAAAQAADRFRRRFRRPGRRGLAAAVICLVALAVVGGGAALLASGGTAKKGLEGAGVLGVSPDAPPEEGADGTVGIATKPMTEQLILGEMLATLIEQDTNLSVQLTTGVGGGTANIQPALERGDFDLYPEYTGTGWNAVLGHEDAYAENRFDDMRAEYEERFGITWTGTYGFNNTYALAVRTDVAERYGLATCSDLARVAGELRLGAEPDFFDRQDGYPGIQQAYGMAFGQTMDMDIGLKYQALLDGQVDAIVVFTTDGQLASPDVTVLQDDLGFYPSYLCCNVVRMDTLAEHPELSGVLAKLEGTISDADMAQMNNQVEEQGQEPKAVADGFLRERGLI